MERLWRSQLVEQLLDRVDAERTRPQGLARNLGLQPAVGDTPGGYRLSEAQAQRILEMQLQRLTALEQDKIVTEYKEVMESIADLLDILAKPSASRPSFPTSCTRSKTSMATIVAARSGQRGGS